MRMKFAVRYNVGLMVEMYDERYTSHICLTIHCTCGQGSEGTGGHCAFDKALNAPSLHATSIHDSIHDSIVNVSFCAGLSYLPRLLHRYAAKYGLHSHRLHLRHALLPQSHRTRSSLDHEAWFRTSCLTWHDLLISPWKLFKQLEPHVFDR